jgi:branched-chain amino acid aminotransferase
MSSWATPLKGRLFISITSGASFGAGKGSEYCRVSRMGEKVYINGRFMDRQRAKVSVFDRGLNYGDGLFETMKAYDGRVFLFKEHLKRLGKGARALRIPTTPLKDIEKKAVMLLKQNGITRGEAYLKIIMTRGVDTQAFAHLKPINPTIIMTARRLDTKPIYQCRGKGIKAVLLNRKGPAEGLGDLKTLNFLPNVVGKMGALRRGAFEGIFTTGDQRLLEGTSTNIFLVMKKIIKTPPLEGILPGITRNLIINLAKKADIPVVEVPLYVKDIKKSDEAFVTNSILEVVPLVRVEATTIGGGSPGRVTRLLQHSYTELRKRA